MVRVWDKLCTSKTTPTGLLEYQEYLLASVGVILVDTPTVTYKNCARFNCSDINSFKLALKILNYSQAKLEPIIWTL